MSVTRRRLEVIDREYRANDAGKLVAGHRQICSMEARQRAYIVVPAGAGHAADPDRLKDAVAVQK